ncbi:hypothetical protein HDU93_006960 [Gonapodya sp. JEL0774]|nr:hypothetical protein HDU93_006960 [Gonapodya sp. JEL0774]
MQAYSLLVAFSVTYLFGSVIDRSKLCQTQAIADVWNTYMGPLLVPLTANNVTVQAGCGQSIDAIMQVLCDPGEGVMIPAPYYNGFDGDATMEPGAILVPCPMSPPSFLFDIASCRTSYDDAIARGITPRVFLLCNPLNPLGRCYSKSELMEIMEFCGEKKLELVVDEIYALSYFGDATPSTSSGWSTKSRSIVPSPNSKPSVLPAYTSIFSMKPPATLPATSIHVLWGLSKDFGLNGVRMGVVLSYSAPVLSALLSIAIQHNVSVPMGLAVAKLLSDKAWVASHVPENKRRIRGMYEVVKQWMDARGVNFCEANAGFFVFVDLRKWTEMVGAINGGVGEAFVVLDEGDADDAGREVVGKVDRTAEYDLFAKFVDGGVLCVNGGSYGCSEIGWFRLVYTAVDSTSDLQLALSRFGKVLDDVESEHMNKVGAL